MIRKVAMLVALCALAAIGAGSASAATNVYCGNTSTICPSGTTIASSTIDGHAILTTSLGNITCSEASFDGTVGASGGTTVTGTLSSLTFGTTNAPSASVCTGTGFAQGVQNCELVSPEPMHATGGTPSGTLTLTTGSFTCRNASNSAICTISVSGGPITGNTSYTEDASGNITSNSVVYTNQNHLAGSGFCAFASPQFSVTFTNVRSAAGALVAVVN